MRHLFVVLDTSDSMKEGDLLRPSRLASAQKVSLQAILEIVTITLHLLSLYINVKFVKCRIFSFYFERHTLNSLMHPFGQPAYLN